jgi:hypothetical protein
MARYSIKPLQSAADLFLWREDRREGILALLTWSAKYSVGVRALDDQHRRLMGVLNELQPQC